MRHQRHLDGAEQQHRLMSSMTRTRKDRLPPGKSLVNGIDVRRHGGLVHARAQRVWRSWGGQPRGGVEYDDLVQAGTEGLIHGAERFDHSLGYAESTYLNWWIRHGISRCVDNESRAVRIPVWVLEKARRERRSPPPGALSLDTPVGDDDGTTFGDGLRDPHAIDPVACIEHEETLEQVRASVDRLQPKLAMVIRARFWGERTLAEVGTEELGGVCRERARQLEVEALDALGSALGVVRRRTRRRRAA
jgi:RNA polymerase primary sigma factor